MSDCIITITPSRLSHKCLAGPEPLDCDGREEFEVFIEGGFGGLEVWPLCRMHVLGVVVLALPHLADRVVSVSYHPTARWNDRLRQAILPGAQRVADEIGKAMGDRIFGRFRGGPRR